MKLRLFIIILVAVSTYFQEVDCQRRRAAGMKPRRVQFPQKGPDFFTISWDHPRRTSEIIGYRLTLIKGDGHDSQLIELDSYSTSFTFRSLHPSTRYQVEVRSRTHAQYSDPAISRVTTTETTEIGLAQGGGTVIKDCKKADKTDIVILIDGSWSVGPSNFKKMQKFLVDLVNAFTIGFDSVLIGMAQYSDDPRTEFTLNQHVTKEALVEAINEMPYKGGNTATGRAIDYIRTTMFSQSYGARRDVHKTAIIITDGESILDSVDEPARRLRDAQVEVFSIGVAAALRSELEAIASPPVDHHVLSVENFDDIQEIKSHLLKEVCSTITLCPKRPAPLHGSMSCSSESIITGVTCTFSCDAPDWKLSVGGEELVRTCLKGGKWDIEQVPSCISAGCNPLTIPHHGGLSCSNEANAGSVCSLICNQGYQIAQDVSRTCEKSGKWSSGKLKCERSKCKDIDIQFSDGHMLCTRGAFYMSQCHFSCNDGYWLDGSEVIGCQGDGTWSGSVPVCRRITCDDVEDEYDINLMRNCTDLNYHGSVCTFECRTGLKVIGDRISVCEGELSPGIWSSTFPSCELITCGPLPEVSNGALKCTEDDRYASFCDLACNDGYESDGLTEIQCDESGEWVGTVATCTKIQCTDLPEIQNGRFNCTQESKFESECTLVCDVGYETTGRREGRRVCQDNGSFTDDGITCKIIQCVRPKPVANGQYDCTNSLDEESSGPPVYGTDCTLVCYEGYELVGGDVTRRCGLNYTFSGSAPVCVRITCPLPDEMPNTMIACTRGDDYGSVCTVSCQPGYKMKSGDTTRVCGRNGQFSGEDLVCERVTCLELETPDHSSMSCSDGNFYDSACYFRCKEGYEISGSSERICQQDETWSGEQAICTKIFCPELKSINHGVKNCTNNNEYASRCHFTCNVGYTQEGSKVRICDQDHRWTGTETVCSIVTCPRLTAAKNGKKRCSDGTNYQSQCKFNCNLGYDLIGESVRTCLASGVWTGAEVACERIECIELEAPKNGHVDCSEFNDFNSKCTFYCKEGYELSGSVTRTCQVDHQWSEPATVCTRIRCSVLSAPANGEMMCTENELYGSICTIKCDSGYELQGSSERECTSIKSWTGSSAVCSLITCASLLPPSHGRKVCDRGSEYGSTCRFVCDVGFNLLNDDVRVCQEDGTWSGVQPECSIVTCEDYSTPENSNIRCSDDSNFGTQCRLTCNVGYELVGSNVRVCQENGQWSSEKDATCVLIECPVISTPENGRIICTESNLYGSECTVICDDGYTLSGSSKRQCRLDKLFSGVEAICSLITCPVLSPPDHGFKNCSAGSAYSSVCRFKCEEGFELIGSELRTCQDSGLWTGMKTTCSMISCGVLPSVGHAFVECSDSARYGSTCTITCDEGYISTGSTVRTCQEDYTWSGEQVICTIVECPILNIPNNGRKVCSDNSNYLSTCRFSCGIGYTLIGSVQRTCMADHIWSGEAAICQIVECEPLNEPENGYLRCSDNDSVYGTKCRIFCNEGYQMEGSSVRVCQDYGEYDGREATCTMIECEKVGALLNGNIECTEDINFDSACLYTCDPGYKLRGSSMRRCKEDSSWTGDVPFCEKLKCSKLVEPPHGSIRCSEANYFQSECRFSCETGYSLVGEAVSICTRGGLWSDDIPICQIKKCILPPPLTHVISDCPTELVYGASCSFEAIPGYLLDGFESPMEYVCNDARLIAYGGPMKVISIQCVPALVPPENGAITCTAGYAFKSECVYTCAAGYELVGPNSRICQADASWSGRQPYCILIECPILEVIPHAVMVCSNDNTLGSRCSISCEDGHKLLGHNVLTCQKSREWDYVPPVCTLVTCGTLPELKNGRYMCSFGDTHDSVCTASCDEGYLLHGSISRTCLDSGDWSGVTSTCRVVKCGPIDAPSHGKVSCSLKDDYGSECFFECNRGFVIIGHISRTCKADGQWSHSQPTCQLVTCNKLFNPANGQVSCSDDNNYNSICQTSCFDGFELIGSAIRLCKEDGVFSGSEAYCNMISCTEIVGLENGSVRCTGGGRYNSVCNHACNPGFQLIGVSTRRCLATGDWSNTAPVCERVVCRPFQLPSNGVVNCSQNYQSGSVCEITCDHCYSLIGSPSRLCRNDGLWSGEPAFCQVAHCVTLRAPANGEIRCSDGLNECGSVCSFGCREGYELIGSAERTCQTNLTWSGQVTECFSNQCPPLSLSVNVVANCSDGNKVGSNCTFQCDGEGTLLGASSIVCQANTRWSGKTPACRMCKRAVTDIFFIIDGSWSVGEQNFDKVKSFLKSLVSPFQVGYDKSRFSIIQYSDSPRLEFALNEYLEMSEVLNAIDGIPYQGGNTKTGHALTFSLYTALSPSNGARPYVSKIAMILTDGRSQDSVANPAHELRQAGVKVIAVGVGDADMAELRQIASPPYDTTVYHVSNYDSIDDIQALLSVKLCESEIPKDNFCGCPAGPPGIPGKPGAKGADGISVKGDKGDAFNAIHINYETQTITAENSDGKVVTLPAPDGLKAVKTKDGTFFPVVGPQGPPGRKGKPGKNGAVGPAGAKGESGADGMQGLKGASGSPGAPGEPGATGEPGTSGGLTHTKYNEILKRAEEYARQFASSEVRTSVDRLVANLGTRGPPGPPGPTGPRGVRGDKGPIGHEGPSGAQGRPGPAGPKGSAGQKGEPGDRGPRGATGYGKPGRPGPRGPKGPRGKSFGRKKGLSKM